jgi:ribosome-associated translation inhibitor RaiA
VNEIDLLEIFLKGPSRGGPLIQIAGIEDVKLMDASELNGILSKFAQKMERFTSVNSVTVRIRHHHHDSDDDKYTANVKVVTPSQVISREAYDWDLLVAIGNAFVHIEQQLKKEKEIEQDRRKMKI